MSEFCSSFKTLRQNPILRGFLYECKSGGLTLPKPTQKSNPYGFSTDLHKHAVEYEWCCLNFGLLLWSFFVRTPQDHRSLNEGVRLQHKNAARGSNSNLWLTHKSLDMRQLSFFMASPSHSELTKISITIKKITIFNNRMRRHIKPRNFKFRSQTGRCRKSLY